MAIGMMSLIGMPTISVLALIEKVFPVGDVIGRIAGVGLIGWGAFVLASAYFQESQVAAREIA